MLSPRGPGPPKGEPRGLFPFATPRPGQLEFLRDAREALARGQHLVAHAPTGLGKTAAALTAALEVALAQGRRVLFLTARQSQHRVAVETLRAMAPAIPDLVVVDAISKQAMCLQPNTFGDYGAFQEFCSYMVRSRLCRYFYREGAGALAALKGSPLHAQELVAVGRRHGVCPHRVAMEAVREAHVVVGDYNYLFSPARDRVLRYLGCRLGQLIVVVDEAHNLPDRIRADLAASLTPGDMAQAAEEARPLGQAMARRLARAAHALADALRGLGEEAVVPPEFLEAALADALGGLDLTALAARAAELGEEIVAVRGASALLTLASFLQGWAAADPAVLRTADPSGGGRLSCRLLDPSPVSGPLFAAVHGSILMSGTLHPAAMFADLLGLEEPRRRIASYPSPFPPGNRLVLAVPGLTTRYGDRSPAMSRAYARVINEIARQVPGNVAAFFPSYELLAAAREALAPLPPAKPLLGEERGMDKAGREALLGVLDAARERGGVLLLGVFGGGLAEGIDYGGNLLQAVLVAGLPLNPPSLEGEALRRYLGERLGSPKAFAYAYLYPAVNRVLQAAGRCIRSETDRGVVVLLDDRFLDPRYRRHFPPGFAWSAAPDPARVVGEFFGTAHRPGPPVPGGVVANA